MAHPIYRVTAFTRVGPYRLKVEFGDGTVQEIDFRPILHGELFGPLEDEHLFNQVRLDTEVSTLVWPTGADLDPATLHDWPILLPELKEMAHQWTMASTGY